MAPPPKKSAIMRLQKELKGLAKDPEPLFRVLPLESNILEWHFCLLIPDDHDSPYRGGNYHGKLILPRDYPFRPPAVYMITPTGRFEPDTRLCLSISDFHPETWSTSWQIRTVVLGLLSFMMDSDITAGSIETDEATKRALAAKSKEFNAKDKLFSELFPELAGGGAEAGDAPAGDAADPGPADSGPGDMVGKELLLGGLKSEAYNGRTVVVERWDAAVGRYQVRMQDDKTVIRVKPENLKT